MHMGFSLKARHTYILKAAALILLAVAVTASVLLYEEKSESVNAYRGEVGFHVVIDAGHGGRDGGTSGRSGIKESDINLSISKYLKTELDSRGIGTTMTRTNFDSLASPFAKNKKKDDMNKRRQIIERTAPDLIVSIHLNAFYSDTKVRGLQCFYAKGSAVGMKYATMIQTEFNVSTLYTNRPPKAADYFILDCTEYPAVLIECGFLSNPEEESMLKTAEYQKILAYHIAAAISQIQSQSAA